MQNALIRHLNAQQRAIVTAGSGAHLVIAGAGTGKTRTLIHRVAWLIEQGVEPRGITLLTFTRRAAAEMLERSASLIGAQGLQVRGGTFHGFAHRVLRQYGETLGYRRDFTLLDASDAESFIGLLRTELVPKTPGRRFPQRGTVLSMLSKRVNTGRSLQHILERDYPQYLDDHDAIEHIGEVYTLRKREQSVLDYDDLLVRLVELLAEHDSVRAKVGGACHHLLIDEYQDTNPVQAQIALLLANERGNLMVVGDEAQSIYGFRGADIRNILRLPELWPGCQVLKLEQNYRSTQPVLDLANGVLAGARDTFNKRLFTELSAGERPLIVHVEDLSDEATYVVQQVLAAREEGVPLREQAVLFRSAAHASLLELELARANVPFRKFGGIAFVDAAHVKDVFALLRLVANPTDELAWFRALQWVDGLGPTLARKLIDQLRAAEPPALDPAWTKGRKVHAGVASLANVLAEAVPLRDDPTALVKHLLAWYKTRLPEIYEDHATRRRDLDVLLDLAARYPTLDAFLAEVTLDPASAQPTPSASTDDEWLTLSTIHSAKGLEWARVWVLSAVTGRFPSIYALDEEDGMEEERRLLYVAVTRAKRRVELLQPMSANGRSLGGDNPFLDELPRDAKVVEHRWWRPVAEPLPDAPGLTDAKDRMARFLAFYGGRPK